MTLTAVSCMNYDIDGNAITTKVNGVLSNVTPSSTNNYAVPGQITTNSLTSTMNWSSFLGPSSVTGPNGDSGSIVYDGNARPSSTTSPYGAATTYTYNTTTVPFSVVATTNGHWTSTLMDGFGRTIETATGYGTTVLSKTDTNYAPCGCSPLGKVNGQSQPYAPGAMVYWTMYHYDGLGRTTSQVAPDGTSTTTYAYAGYSVTATDPAGKWKTFYMDALGNLWVVGEPDPTLGTVTTGYAYDVLNHLTLVYMQRGSNVQTRAFNYNVGTTVTGFLQSATNPENGTVSYTYNANNLLATKTDAKSQTLTYAYDTYNRLTSVSAGSTVLRTYYYDTNPLQSGFSQNALGRLTAVQYPALGSDSPHPAPIQLVDMYSYTQAGLPATKRLQVNQTYYWTVSGNGHQAVATDNLDSTYTYNSEGKITAMTYPSTVSGTTTTPGPSYNYSYDQMYRLSGMTSGSTTVVNGVSYNAANQLLGMSYFGDVNESRTYNSLNQLVNLTTQSVVQSFNENLTYTYPTGTNNGKISSMSNAISGETVTYTYDSLNRLLTAAGTGGGANWGEQYGFDPFGNLLSKTVTAGSGPSMTVTANAATNQIGIFSYDANGNATVMYNGTQEIGLNYDAENRMVVAGNVNGPPMSINYAYDAQNRRIYASSGAADSNGDPTNYAVNVYTPGGQKLGAYNISILLLGQSPYTPTMQVALTSSDTYFGARRLAPMDQLGSAGNNNYSAGTYFPWGEPKGGTNPQDAWSYATYWTDSFSSLDYANNRYYSNAYGRFMTPDPYQAMAKGANDPMNPQSWNRYAYVTGDPVNRIDPTGRDWCDPEDPNCDPECGQLCFPAPISPFAPLPNINITIACDVQVFAQPIAGVSGAYHAYIQTIVEVAVDGLSTTVSQVFQATDQTKSNPQVQCTKQAALKGQCWLNNISTPPVISAGSNAPASQGGTQIFDSGFSASECGNVSAIAAASAIYPNNTNTYQFAVQNSNSFVYTLLTIGGIPTSTVLTNALSDGIPLVGWGIFVPFFN